MPSYTHLKRALAEGGLDLTSELSAALGRVAELRAGVLESGGQHVVFYASGYFQKRGAGPEIDIDMEDINGFMNALYRVEMRSLTLILHTPGGDGAAVESIVEYLHSKYDYIEVIVPAYAMSAGAMISLASDHIIMSRAGQLGPMDPQMDGLSAWVINEGYKKAEDDVRESRKLARLWEPLMERMGPFLPLEARDALYHGHKLVRGWLKSRGLLADKKAADDITAYFNTAPSDSDDGMFSHDKRIGLRELREKGLNASALEDSQELQDAVMKAYWLMTLIFEQTHLTKFIASNTNEMWEKPAFAGEE